MLERLLEHSIARLYFRITRTENVKSTDTPHAFELLRVRSQRPRYRCTTEHTKKFRRLMTAPRSSIVHFKRVL